LSQLSFSTPAGQAQLGRRRLVGSLALVLGVALAARVAFILCTPRDVYSADVNNWRWVVASLERGLNPYQSTTFLNWPPLWMQILFGLNRLAAVLGLTLFQAVRAFLITVEGALIVWTFILVSRTSPSFNARRLLLVGIALNPIAILLVCQHCNFDVLVAFWVLLFVIEQTEFQATGSATAWLGSCLWLGLGVLTKTVPLVLAPLLLVGIRSLRWKERTLGGLLLFGPVVLGMSIVYSLVPAAIERNVLGYRSAQGWFGITGLLGWTHRPGLMDGYSRLSPWLFGVALVALSRVLWTRARLTAAQVMLLSALLLMAVVVFGPGYGPQYIFWFMPLLIASYPLFGNSWRKGLAAFYVIAALTYCFEYSLFPSHGMLLIRLGLGEQWTARANAWSTPEMQTLFRLPLFLSYVGLFALGGSRLGASMSASAPSPDLAQPPI
jgi:hypothetical protein